MVAAGQPVATPFAPSVVPTQPSSSMAGPGGGGGFGGGGGGAGGVQAGAWFGAAKQKEAADKLGAIAQKVDRGGVASAETEMFARRYGIAPSTRSDPAATPPAPARPAGGRATTATAGNLALVVPEPDTAAIAPPEFSGRPTATAPARKPDGGSVNAPDVKLTGIVTLEGKSPLGSTVRGFYDDNGVAKGAVVGDDLKITVAPEGKPALTAGGVTAWGDYDNDEYLDLKRGKRTIDKWQGSWCCWKCGGAEHTS